MNRLPALDQIVLESQRPLLAVLDTTLVLVVRSMRAEHPELEDDACRHGDRDVGDVGSF